MLCCPAARRSFAAGTGIFAGFLFLIGLQAGLSETALADEPQTDQKADTVLDHTVKNLDGAEVDLGQYRGKVVLVVNVASRCGFTKQYKPLEKIYEKHKDDGFVVLGFPCNQFGGQEPGSPAEIAAFCEKNYGVSFPLMGKVEVKGPGAIPLYEELTADGATTDPGPVKWNFEKFLIGRDGRVIERFRSQVSPDSRKMMKAVREALKADAPADVAVADTE
ncbi:MAG: glutathione peroxidase [Planctomycetota bacterium]